MDIKEIMNTYGLSVKILTDKGIPKRTVENWQYNVTKPPAWVCNLLCFAATHGYFGQLTAQKIGSKDA